MGVLPPLLRIAKAIGRGQRAAVGVRHVALLLLGRRWQPCCGPVAPCCCIRRHHHALLLLLLLLLLQRRRRLRKAAVGGHRGSIGRQGLHHA